jgi:hypothetical protein
MYRVVLYYLALLWVVALIFSFFGILPYSPVSMLLSLAILLATGFAANNIFAYIFKVPANIESVYISVFILALIYLFGLGGNFSNGFKIYSGYWAQTYLESGCALRRCYCFFS